MSYNYGGGGYGGGGYGGGGYGGGGYGGGGGMSRGYGSSMMRGLWENHWLVIGAVLAVIGVIAYFIISGQGEDAPEEPAPAQPTPSQPRPPSQPPPPRPTTPKPKPGGGGGGKPIVPAPAPKPTRKPTKKPSGGSSVDRERAACAKRAHSRWDDANKRCECQTNNGWFWNSKQKKCVKKKKEKFEDFSLDAGDQPISQIFNAGVAGNAAAW